MEEVFGWMKTVGGLRRTRSRDLARTGLAGYLVATAYNLMRMAHCYPKRSLWSHTFGYPAAGSTRPEGVPPSRIGTVVWVCRS